MKFKFLAVLIIFNLTFLYSYSQIISPEIAIKIVSVWIHKAHLEDDLTLKSIIPIKENERIYCFAAELSPQGFVIVAADQSLSPVIAYSFQDKLEDTHGFFSFMKYDISLRLLGSKVFSENRRGTYKLQWDKILKDEISKDSTFQQWPAYGTTPTGGWLNTNWTQTSPYNQMCPNDPVTNLRSYTGCPATAMAQILNFHKTTNGIVFSDDDDYFHQYAGRNFQIDDDAEQLGFPSFPQLNAYLDTVNLHYQNNTSLSNQDKAALTFACGIAAKQVFTSEGSGTFSVSQAYDAYQRFGFTTSELIYDTEADLYLRLAQNMKDTLPAHLAIVDPSWSTGHNVVVDGYNTDNYFHLNFGWGGSNNGWYLLPEQIPYNLTVLEGVILDINKQFTSVHEFQSIPHFSVYPNPASSTLQISFPEKYANTATLNIYNSLGQIIKTTVLEGTTAIISLENMVSGVYFVKIYNSQTQQVQPLIIQR